jgi:hypothetical protein
MKQVSITTVCRNQICRLYYFIVLDVWFLILCWKTEVLELCLYVFLAPSWRYLFLLWVYILYIYFYRLLLFGTVIFVTCFLSFEAWGSHDGEAVWDAGLLGSSFRRTYCLHISVMIFLHSLLFLYCKSVLRVRFQILYVVTIYGLRNILSGVRL